MAPSDEERRYEQAVSEIASGNVRAGLWAQAFAESDGDNVRAQAAYLRLRVRAISAEEEFDGAQRQEEADAGFARRKKEFEFDEARRKRLYRQRDGFLGYARAMGWGCVAGFASGFLLVGGLAVVSNSNGLDILALKFAAGWGLGCAPIGALFALSAYTTD